MVRAKLSAIGHRLNDGDDFHAIPHEDGTLILAFCFVENGQNQKALRHAKFHPTGIFEDDRQIYELREIL